MTAPALRMVPSMDEVRDHVDDIRDRVMSLPQMSLPRFQEVGRQADVTVDRLRGRPSRPFWFKPLIVIGVVGIIATLAAMATTWSRGRISRRMDEAALDQHDRMSEHPTSGLEVASVETIDSPADFGTATFIEAGTVGLNDQQADVH